MSRILKHKKKLLIYLTGFAVCAVFLWALTQRIFVIAVGCGLYLTAAVLNELVRWKIDRQKEPFGINSRIRNVDYLIIGDYCDVKDHVPDEASHIEFFAPGRSYQAAFQILRHTHSILKEEGGTVIMTIGKGKKLYTVFDIAFFHEITIRKYGLQMLKKLSRFPLVAEPLNSLRFLVGGGTHSTYISSDNVPSDLRTFCDERNYRLILLKKVSRGSI